MIEATLLLILKLHCNWVTYPGFVKCPGDLWLRDSICVAEEADGVALEYVVRVGGVCCDDGRVDGHVDADGGGGGVVERGDGAAVDALVAPVHVPDGHGPVHAEVHAVLPDQRLAQVRDAVPAPEAIERVRMGHTYEYKEVRNV